MYDDINAHASRWQRGSGSAGLHEVAPRTNINGICILINDTFTTTNQAHSHRGYIIVTISDIHRYRHRQASSRRSDTGSCTRVYMPVPLPLPLRLHVQQAVKYSRQKYNISVFVK